MKINIVAEYLPLKNFIKEYSEKNITGKYRPVAVGRYGIRTRESIYSKELAKDYSKNKLIYKNTLTVGMGSVQIDIGILTDDNIYSVSPAYHTYKINGIDGNYLRYCLQYCNKDMFERFVVKSARQGKSIDFKRWLDYKIPVYNETTQRFIVDYLNKVLKLTNLYNKQLSHLDDLVKARFVEMFGDLENNTKGWYIQQLEELCKISSSKRIYRKEQSDFGVPFLRIADLMDKINNGITKSELFISAEKYNELCLLGLVPKKGDILLTARGTLGKCYIIQNDDKFYFQDGMITWLSDFSNNITALFLKYLFSTDWLQKQITELQAGSTVAYLSIAMTKKLYIPLPPIKLQNEFAEFVKQIDKSKFIIENLTARRLFYA